MNAHTITFDTLVYLDRLKSAGVSEEIARAHAEGLDQALRESVATKSDLEKAETSLRSDITELPRSGFARARFNQFSPSARAASPSPALRIDAWSQRPAPSQSPRRQFPRQPMLPLRERAPDRQEKCFVLKPNAAIEFSELYQRLRDQNVTIPELVEDKTADEPAEYTSRGANC